MDADQAEEMAKKLQKANKSYEYYSYESDTHGEIPMDKLEELKKWIGCE